MKIEDVKINTLYKSDANGGSYYVPVKYDGRASVIYGGCHTWDVVSTRDFKTYTVECLGDAWFDIYGKPCTDKKALKKILENAYIYFEEEK